MPANPTAIEAALKTIAAMDLKFALARTEALQQVREALKNSPADRVEAE